MKPQGVWALYRRCGHLPCSCQTSPFFFFRALYLRAFICEHSMVRIKVCVRWSPQKEHFEKELHRSMTSCLGCQGNVTESGIAKGAHLAPRLLPSTSGGRAMQGAERKRERGENKTRGRVDPAARSTCQKNPGDDTPTPDVASFGLASPGKESRADEPFFTVTL